MNSFSPTQWCISSHEKTNHFYDNYLPYEFHLRMVNNVAQQFKHLLDDDVDYYVDYYTGKKEYGHHGRDETVTLREAVMIAVWGHDLIEDARVSFNDVKMHLGPEAADIVYAVTNEKGKNRAERANAKYYEGIRNTPGAVFVKLCDRIANVQYSKLTKSRMFETYKAENHLFGLALGLEGQTQHPYYAMYAMLLELFESPNDGFKN